MTVAGEQIRNARKARNMTLRDVAKAAGLSTSFVCDVERGRKSMSLKTAAPLAEALGLSLDGLVGVGSIDLPRVEAAVHLRVAVQQMRAAIALLPSLYNDGLLGHIHAVESIGETITRSDS